MTSIMRTGEVAEAIARRVCAEHGALNPAADPARALDSAVAQGRRSGRTPQGTVTAAREYAGLPAERREAGGGVVRAASPPRSGATSPTKAARPSPSPSPSRT